MSTRMKFTGLLLTGLVCLPLAAHADTQTPHRVHKVKKQAPPPPLPSGPQGPVPQIPLDAIPAVAPEVSFQDGLLTIVAPNSTLSDILRSVHKQTSAEIEIPASASERVVTRLGPAPAREVMAELLNGSHFNYILLGSPEDANALTRVVLVAKSPDTPAAPGQPNPTPPVAANTAADDSSAADDNAVEEDQSATVEPEQPAANPDQPGVKTPQQMLQEMQQRQLQMQQQPGAQGANPANPPLPGASLPGRQFQPQQPQNPPDQQ
jgi:hypothetical protein